MGSTGGLHDVEQVALRGEALTPAEVKGERDCVERAPPRDEVTMGGLDDAKHAQCSAAAVKEAEEGKCGDER